MKDVETKTESSLRSKVESTRSQAREILRARFINSLLQDLFHDTKEFEIAQKCLANNEKKLKVKEYDLNKLDTERPDADDLKKNLEEGIEYIKKQIEECKKCVQNCKENVDSDNAAITKVEVGETLMSIDEIKKLTDELLGV